MTRTDYTTSDGSIKVNATSRITKTQRIDMEVASDVIMNNVDEILLYVNGVMVKRIPSNSRIASMMGLSSPLY